MPTLPTLPTLQGSMKLMALCTLSALLGGHHARAFSVISRSTSSRLGHSLPSTRTTIRLASAASGDSDASELSSLTVVQLKERLRAAGLQRAAGTPHRCGRGRCESDDP